MNPKEKTMTIKQTAIIQAANYHMTKAWERQAAGVVLTPARGVYAVAAYRLACAGRHAGAGRMAALALVPDAAFTPADLLYPA